MRTIKLQVQISVDGFMAGPGGEMDWMVWNWDDALNNYVTGIMKNIDLILLGRKLAEGFIPHWEKVASDAANPENASGKVFSDTKKIVFSKSLTASPWKNTVVNNGDLVREIEALKRTEGGDIFVYGGSAFVRALTGANLIDEYHLFINPNAMGGGLKVFDSRIGLKLEDTIRFECGIVVLKYSAVR
ncbi:MAG: dihydrofolate reductase family protein [Treponemataceae bacterium]